MRLAVALFALWPATAHAQTAVDTSPTPQVRPDPEDRTPELLVEIAPDGALDITEDDSPPVRIALEEPDADFAACLARLDDFGTAYGVVAAVTDEDDVDCGIERPVAVSEIIPGVALQPDAKMRCETAVQLAQWLAGSVQPAATLMATRGAVVQVDHGSTYICRRRNNAPDGVLSEHAFGNAVDVMGFMFEDGSRLVIEPRADAGTIEEAFQRAVRGTACLGFSTVIGPGTDAAHADHLHLDVKARNGGYRICQ